MLVLSFCVAVMWIACKRGDLGTSKVDRRLFVYACMALPACIVFEQNEWGYLGCRSSILLNLRSGNVSRTLK